MRHVVIVLTASLVLAAPRFADAADRATKQARAHYERGNRRYDAGEYREALAEYQEAYRKKPLPGFLFNIGQCHRKLGEYQLALDAYQKYLEQLPNAPNRADVEDLITECQQKLGEERQAAEERERAEREAREREERARAEEERRRAEGAAATQPTQPPVRRGRPARHPARWAAIVGAVAGAALLGTGGYFAWDASSAQSAFDDAGCGDPSRLLDASELSSCRDERSRGESSAKLANVLGGGGGLLLVGSIVLYLIDPGGMDAERPPAAGQARVLIGPSSVGVSWAF